MHPLIIRGTNTKGRVSLSVVQQKVMQPYPACASSNRRSPSPRSILQAIHSDNTCARVSLIVGQRQQSQNLALGISSEAERFYDRPDMGCRIEVEISGLFIGERTSEKLYGSTSKVGLDIPARKIREQLLVITQTPQARDQQDNADRFAIRFEQVAIPRQIGWRGSRS